MVDVVSGDLFDLPGAADVKILHAVNDILTGLTTLTLEDQVATINAIRLSIHKYSPFRSEPVDCVQWIRGVEVKANDYNPNNVAPPELKLLEHSITEDGYTQPIVAWKNGQGYEVVDGFHRNRIGKESEAIKIRLGGYLPVTIVNESRLDRGDRIAATIRHNRARGKHRVEAMSDIVVELKRRNWSDEKIGKELGMEPDEVLRLCQITGLAEVFKDQEFSSAWEVDRTDAPTIADEILSDMAEDYDQNDKSRIFHTWEKWECFKSGFYAERPAGMTQDEGEEKYREFLSDLSAFELALQAVTYNWIYSCEHYLTNDRMNRIAWLGQASVSYALGIPSVCRGGYHRLTEDQKRAADELALRYLNAWLTAHERAPVSLVEASGRTEAELY